MHIKYEKVSINLFYSTAANKLNKYPVTQLVHGSAIEA